MEKNEKAKYAFMYACPNRRMSGGCSLSIGRECTETCTAYMVFCKLVDEEEDDVVKDKPCT